ncbi:MAG TPA: DinB family protein [Holophagaceae bacterium]|nr:DinB family protein [Holophagaceae bacterium]
MSPAASQPDRELALAALSRMPDRLEAWTCRLTEEALRRRTESGGFAPLEHIWHLAELETVFGTRLARLRDEARPHLADFHGDTAATAGRYLERAAAEGLARFRAARTANLAAFAALAESHWLRQGTQEGLGPVTLGDLPGRMMAHDLDHASTFKGF